MILIRYANVFETQTPNEFIFTQQKLNICALNLFYRGNSFEYNATFISRKKNPFF